MPDNAKGVLFRNADKKGNGPDWSGNVELTTELLQVYLAEAQQNGGKYKARLAAWVKDGPRGKFQSLSMDAPFKKGGGASAPARRQEMDDPF